MAANSDCLSANNDYLSANGLLLYPARSHDVPAVSQSNDVSERRPASAVSPGPQYQQQPFSQHHFSQQQHNHMHNQFLAPIPPHLRNPQLQDDVETKRRRFSLLRFRNASDSQLSLRARRDAEKERPPPLPRAPEGFATLDQTPNSTINTMSSSVNVPRKKRSRLSLVRRSGGPTSSLDDMLSALQESSKIPKTPTEQSLARPPPSPLASSLQPADGTNDDVHASSRATTPVATPPVYGDHDNSVLALPISRVSDSSRSDASSAIYASTTTTQTTVKTTTTFFRLKKKPPELFPIGHLQQSQSKQHGGGGGYAGTGAGAGSAIEGAVGSHGLSTSRSSLAPPGGPSASHGAITPPRASLGGNSPSTGLAVTTNMRQSSGSRSNASPTRSNTLRGRSSTMGSTSQDSTDERHLQPGSRASSTAGRKSFGDLLGLGRLRQNPDLARAGTLTPSTPGSAKNSSFQISREPSFVLPERRDDETPAKYLGRLEEVVSRAVVASLLAKATDAFAAAALRSYMRSFSFFGDPMDMAIRKLLMEAELPKETQQIDRCLQAFANRYHECNPGIYSSPDQAYFIAFSLLILHTDVFNKNNKHKMQKVDYLKNTHGEGIDDEILECFYDNISYTPFIHVEDDLDINGERIPTHKSRKKTFFASASNGAGGSGLGRSSKDMIDPYSLIIDGKLGVLRPSIKDVIDMDDHYSYLGTAQLLNLADLQKAFFKTGVLQIISARSRPDAFMSERTTNNPEDSHVGIVDIKITKVGLLWRKDAKKKKTRSPWQEWGAILTGAKLYFFRNTAWIKSLMSQYEGHVKQGLDDTPLIFKPPLEHFKPDAHVSTDGAVALVDSTYKKHKHAFMWIPHASHEEVLLAETEEEMNDWLAKLNYAAAFRTSGVRIRGVMGGNYDVQNRRGMRQLGNSDATQVVQTPTGEVSIARSRIDPKMADDILTARRLIMRQKIAEANEKMATLQKQLDSQLRNGRHLQILAPIQAKTRENVLASAARLAAKLKWTRFDIWRITCHRDILTEDLEDEHRFSVMVEKALEEATATTTAKDVSGEGGSTPAVSSSSLPLATAEPTAPTSPTVDAPAIPRSPDIATAADASSLVRDSDTASANDTIKPSPVRIRTRTRSPSSRAEHASTHGDAPAHQSPPSSPKQQHATHEESTPRRESRKDDDDDDEDHHEHELLREAGLLGTTPVTTPERTSGMLSDSHDSADGPGSGDRSDKSKIRRSLQRTLREGAGHLSHHRSRRGGRENTQSMVFDDATRDDVLTRGSGSFVVHGKKASVITFGNELQQMSNEEKLRQRRQTLCEGDGVLSSSMMPLTSITSTLSISASVSTPSIVDEDVAHAAAGFHDGSAGSEYMPTRSHRESTASTDTATARSFRELHRKYSTAQAARTVSASGRLALPSDDDSEAAVSFSDGRRTPLPADLDIAEELESVDGGEGVAKKESEQDEQQDEKHEQHEQQQDEQQEQAPSQPSQP